MCRHFVRCAVCASILVLLALLQPANGGCFTARPRRYRDCTCGVKYRDVETRCCDSDTCIQPILFSENRDCDYQCANGGTLNADGDGCDCKDGYYGPCCQRETEHCGDIFLTAKGEFKSPNYPNNYPNNSRCVWRITTDPARRIALGIKNDAFEVEPGSSIYSCNHDWISVYDGKNKDGRRIGSYCGNGMRTFQTVRSSGRHMYIEFVSDWQQRRQGFHLQWTTFFSTEVCGPKQQFTRPIGIITSPQYPLNYRPHERCVYRIRVRAKHDLVLKTEEMNMPARADCTGGDRVLISREKGKKVSHMTVLCGKRQFSPYTVRATNQAQYIRLEFTSDYKREGKFLLRYEQIPVF